MALGEKQGGSRSRFDAGQKPDLPDEARLPPDKKPPVTRVVSPFGAELPVEEKKGLIHIGHDPLAKNADGGPVCNMADYFSARRCPDLLERDLLVVGGAEPHMQLALYALDYVNQQRAKKGASEVTPASEDFEKLCDAYVSLDRRGADWRIRVSEVDRLDDQYWPAENALRLSGVPGERIKFYSPTDRIGLIRALAERSARYMVDPIASDIPGMRQEVEEARKNLPSGNQFYHADTGTRYLSFSQFADLGSDLKDKSRFLGRFGEVLDLMKSENKRGNRELQFFGVDERKFFGVLEEKVYGVSGRELFGSRKWGRRHKGRRLLHYLKDVKRSAKRGFSKRPVFKYEDLKTFHDWARETDKDTWDSQKTERFRSLLSAFTAVLPPDLKGADFNSDGWISAMHSDLRESGRREEAHDLHLWLDEVRGLHYLPAGRILQKKRGFLREDYPVKEPTTDHRIARNLYDAVVSLEGTENGAHPAPKQRNRWRISPATDPPRVRFANVARIIGGQEKYDIMGSGTRPEYLVFAGVVGDGGEQIKEYRFRRSLYCWQDCVKHFRKAPAPEGGMVFGTAQELRERGHSRIKTLKRSEAQRLSREYFQWMWMRVKAMQSLGMDILDIDMTTLPTGEQYLYRENVSGEFLPENLIPSAYLADASFTRGVAVQMGVAGARSSAAAKTSFGNGDEALRIISDEERIIPPSEHKMLDPIQAFYETQKPIVDDTDRYSLYLAKLLVNAACRSKDGAFNAQQTASSFAGGFAGELRRLQKRYRRDPKACEGKPDEWRRNWQDTQSEGLIEKPMNPQWDIDAVWKKALSRLDAADPKAVSSRIAADAVLLYDDIVSRTGGDTEKMQPYLALLAGAHRNEKTVPETAELIKKHP